MSRWALEGIVRRREMLKLAGSAALGAAAYVGGEKLYDSITAGENQLRPRVNASPGKHRTTPAHGGSAITSRPNDGTGYWPDASNTGYINAPEYTGSLTEGPKAITTGSTYSNMSFNGCYVGLPDASVDNVTFVGCLFWGVKPGLPLVQCSGNNIIFEHCSFMPTMGGPSSYVTYDQSYQYAVLYDGGEPGTKPGRLKMNWCDVWGYGNGLQIDGSTRAAPHSVTNCWFHHAADTAAAPGGGTGIYHEDAILCTVGGANETYLLISSNSLASVGSTNAIALQRDGGNYYNHITATNNYLSGFGYTVQIGGNGSGNSHITFTGNVWSTEIAAQFGPLYGWGETDNIWRENKWQVFPGDPANPVNLTTAASGEYWWPTDNDTHSTDYSGD